MEVNSKSAPRYHTDYQKPPTCTSLPTKKAQRPHERYASKLLKAEPYFAAAKLAATADQFTTFQKAAI